MSWTSWSQSITKIAREAQRGIDKVLDISEENGNLEIDPDGSPIEQLEHVEHHKTDVTDRKSHIESSSPRSQPNSKAKGQHILLILYYSSRDNLTLTL